MTDRSRRRDTASVRPPPRERLRQVANLLNQSTTLGLLIAYAGGARPSRGPRGTLLATGYRFGFPAASAFTVGDVIITMKSAAELADRPRLVRHETRHCTQYACCLGPVMLPAYGLAAAWSWLRTGDPASRNVFERRAGLSDGGYVEHPLRTRS